MDKISEGNYRNYVNDKLTCEIMEINHSGPRCSFYKFYKWYIFQYNTHVFYNKKIIGLENPEF